MRTNYINMKKISIVGDLGDFKNNFVVFEDGTNEIVLAVTRSDEYAEKLRARFQERLANKKVLVVHKSAYGLND